MSQRPPAHTPEKTPTWLDHPFFRHPLVRRITGYSAGSVVAIIVSEAAFAAALGWGHTGTTIASACGFVGGAVPNYILNRRWAWRDRRGRDRKSELVLYMIVSLASFLVSAFVTHWAETAARHVTADGRGQVAITTLAYLVVSAVFFVVKFVIYETVVFRKHPKNHVLDVAVAAPEYAIDALAD
jgi:putative flippase GtrA